MTKAQKQFILKQLIPFILREQGRGFCMSEWKLNSPPGTSIRRDGVKRKVPSCGTVCCIGGSIQVLKGYGLAGQGLDFATAGAVIGLDSDESSRLFDWDMCWPKKFADKWFAAKTPIGKARVAVSLLREVVRTDGKVLDY